MLSLEPGCTDSEELPSLLSLYLGWGLKMHKIFTSPPIGLQSIVISESACLYVCLSVCLSVRSHVSKTTVQISPNFLHMLPVVVARSSTDGNAIRYVFPVLRMKSCFHIMQRICPNWVKHRRHLWFGPIPFIIRKHGVIHRKGST